MSFVTTAPEALAAAATKLKGIGSALAAENAAAAAPTTAVVPAAADEVSALQAAQYSAFGNLYQSVSAQAQAVHQMLVNTLGTSAGSYGQTEAANQAAAGSTPLSSLLAPAQAADPSSGGTVAFGINAAQNFSSAASDMISTASLATLPGYGAPTPGGAVAGATGLAGDVTSATSLPAVATAPAGSAGLGATPTLASIGQASSIKGLSVPPAWAAESAAPTVSSPATLAGAGWTGAAPPSAPVTTMPAGMPALATAGKAGGLGAPRYGVKPTVMPKPAVV